MRGKQVPGLPNHHFLVFLRLDIRGIRFVCHVIIVCALVSNFL